MSVGKKIAVIIGISSDIGSALGKRWLENDWQVIGTYWHDQPLLQELRKKGAKLIKCDILSDRSINRALKQISQLTKCWDALVMCPATQEPVGNFVDCNFEDWEKSLKVNFTSHYRIVHDLLWRREKKLKGIQPVVIFFAGGATNNATVNYSAYTISKVAQIKMCELLDAEIPSIRFTILGPGWVKTKIHEATLKAGKRAGKNYQLTKNKLSSNELTPMDKVLDCCDWVVRSSRQVVSGRNFSVVFDAWNTEELANKLKKDPNMYKLRRSGNDWKP